MMRRWFLVYGFPRVIMSDNGPGFSSNEMKACMKAMGVKCKFVLPYHPQANGICERFNDTIINSVKSYIQDPKKQNMWSEYINHVVFAYNTSIHPATGYTPFYLMHAREAIIGSEAILRTPPYNFQPYPIYVKHIQRDMFIAHKHIANRVQQQANVRERLNSEMKSTASYITGDQVMIYKLPKSMKGISAKLVSPYIGPCTVINQFNDVSYQIKRNDNNKKMVVHVSRMKKYTARDKDLHDALVQADAEAARDAAGVAVLPLERNVGDNIDDVLSGYTRSRVAARQAQHPPRPRNQRSHPPPQLLPKSREQDYDEKHDEPHVPHHAIDISHSDDSDMEEGEVRHIPHTPPRH
jgi:hypothetical protein